MLKQPDLTHAVSVLAQIPFAVLVTPSATSGRIKQTLSKEWPTTKMQHVYRYLQIWKERCWIKHIPDTRFWSLTNMGNVLLERQIAEQGWPTWLTKHGYNKTDFVFPSNDHNLPS